VRVSLLCTYIHADNSWCEPVTCGLDTLNTCIAGNGDSTNHSGREGRREGRREGTDGRDGREGRREGRRGECTIVWSVLAKLQEKVIEHRLNI
jgi:hypothetical protein